MIERIAEASPRLRARIAGVFYLLTILAGTFAAVFAGRSFGDAANLIASVCYVAVTLLLYAIFRPVDRSLSLIAAVFSLVGCAIGALGVFHLSSRYLPNSLVLFGVYCLLIGYLILKSTFLPRILGVLMAFGGLGWLTFVSAQLADYLSPYNLAPGILGEGALTVWLLTKGVSVERWKEQARAAEEWRL